MGADEFSSTLLVLARTGEANYADDVVEPDSGAGGSSFTFGVEYTEVDNNAPALFQVNDIAVN